MTSTNDSCTDGVATGNPIFADPACARIAAEQGAAAAWTQAFRSAGATAAEGVSGDFAVGIREPDGRVFLAVDRFAIRSLCYRVDGNAIHFAERADDLADASSEIDPQSIFDYLYLHVIASPATIFKNVRRLPPGHFGVFENGRLHIAPYWIPSFSEDKHSSLKALSDEFRQILRDSVGRQLEGHDTSKIGCFLSGGTDSSTVAGMFGEVVGHPASTYSIGFDAAGYDEMEFARIAASRFKTSHHEYYITPDDLVRSIPEVASYYDQPFGNSSALPAYYCAQMAKADGKERMLAGDGGDELFGGNTRYAKQRVFGWYDAIPSPLRKTVFDPAAGLPGMSSIPLLKKGASYVQQARVPMPDRLQTYNLLFRLGLDTVLTPAFLAQVDPHHMEKEMRGVWAQPEARSLVNRMLAFDWRYTLAECDLPKVCGTTRLAKVAVGFPLLDDRLLNFSLRLPPHFKLKGLKLRWFFKEALRGFLPDEIITKKKQGFGLPFGVWATRHPALKQLATESLYALSQRGVVNDEFVKDLLQKRLAQHPGYYGEMIWILMMLEQWLRIHAPKYQQ